jgi:hypothetical protein
MTELGQRQAASVPRVPRLKVAAAVLILGTTLAGAVILHGHRVLQPYPCPPTGFKCYRFAHLVRPSWVDPLALGTGLLGLAAAAGGLVRPLRRFTAAALVLAAAVGGAVALSGHRVLGAEYSCPGTAGSPCFYHPRPGWVVPTMAGFIMLGLAGAGILVATRRRSS